MQQELQKCQLYRDTIKKQEMVITKLEKLLEVTLKETDQASKKEIELERLKTENIQIQKKLKEMALGKEESDELGKYRDEITKLERIKHELVEELKHKRPMTGTRRQVEEENLDLEINLKKAEDRVETLNAEIRKAAVRFSEEIITLQSELREKQAKIEALNYK